MASMIAGGNAALTAENPQLDQLVVGLGWDTIPSNGPSAELVPFAVMCDSSGRAISNDHLVFFNQLASADGSVAFVGDEDDEQIDVTLSMIPENVAKIVFFIYVDPEVRGKGTFASVRGTHIRVSDQANRELVRFDIPGGRQEGVTAMIMGELYRNKSDWKFRALGQGYSTGLEGVAKDYGIGA